MPHTSHKKKAIHKKRREVLDEEGWTRVTSTSSAREVLQEPTARGPQTGLEGSLGDRPILETRDVALRPMDPVKGTTAETMRMQYDKIEARWLESDMCKTFREILRQSILAGSEPAISNCLIFGSGSFCGDEIHWIDRHESAYYQIAAFKTAAATIAHTQGRWPPCYAQEPCYNHLDAEFLAGLNISRVDHPEGFHQLDGTSFVYSPAAEPEVELQIMSHDPQIWLHRSFEHKFQSDRVQPNHDLSESFKKTHAFAQLPPLDLKNLPFHGSVLWWRKTADQETEP